MGRLIAKILAWLAILLGLALLIQPTAAQWWTSTRNAKTAAQFAARAEAQPTAPAAEETTAEPPPNPRAPTLNCTPRCRTITRKFTPGAKAA